MSDQMATFLAGIAGFLGAVAGNTVRALLPMAALFIPIWYLERRQGSDTSRYRRRHFAHDVAYALFYDSGAFRVLGASLIWSAVQNQLNFMRIGLLDGLPIVLVGALYLVINDFISYWLHRAEHSVPFLWQFHSVHHASEELNYLTASRVHPFSKLMWGFVGILLLIVLGVPPTMWLLLTLVQTLLATVQHAELDWSYGRLYPVLVSPVFHRLHHSRDRRDFDKNYSQLFGIWDHLFGTANPSRTPPAAVGVEGLPPERTLIGQFLGPFRRIGGPGKVSPRRSDRPERSPATRP